MTAWKTGITTGTCAAAAAKAAVLHLCGKPVPLSLGITLPAGNRIPVPVHVLRNQKCIHSAAVIKDAGSDPDVTHGLQVIVSASSLKGSRIEFRAGRGVGTVTKRGLSVRPGEPAINPVPRRMITEAVREVTRRGLRLTISIPGGDTIARKTFNPRLGIKGGLSILGTSGEVRPFSSSAMREALGCCFNVARAARKRKLVLVPGHIGAKAAIRHFHFQTDQLIEIGNEWGFALDQATAGRFTSLLIVGHPGKLAKLASGDWDTHSARSKSARPAIARLGKTLIPHFKTAPGITVESIFEALAPAQRHTLGQALAGRIRTAARNRIGSAIKLAVVLISMDGDIIGTAGELTPWTRKKRK